jgi:hypothetical protein
MPRRSAATSSPADGERTPATTALTMRG